MTKYRRINQNFNDLVAGLQRAQQFYSDMKETVTSLQKNVETFVNNRRSEGGQLLARIEQGKGTGADQEQQRLKDLMERMSMEPSGGSPVSTGSGGRKKSVPPPLSSTPGYPSTSSAGHMAYNPAASPPVTPRYPPTNQPHFTSPQQSYGGAPSTTGFQPPPRRESYQQYGAQQPPQHQHTSSQSYNPAQHQYNPVSPPAHQQFFSPPPPQHPQHQPWGQPPQQQQQNQWAQNVPQGYVPPPPPPGPPPPQQQDYSHFGGAYPGGPGGYAQGGRPQQQQGQQQQGQGQGQNDPWAGLSSWK